MSEIIERPYENFYCDNCFHRVSGDFCLKYRLGLSYAYCPHIRNCEWFEEE